MHSDILRPVVTLVAWSLVMLVWLVTRRIPALKVAGIDLGKARGGRPGALDGVVPEQVQWPAHNYMHLMEQPTIFYAVALTLAVIGAGSGLNAGLAWAYVGLRIAHSVVHATVNRILFRFWLFAISSLVLMALTVRAAIAVF